MDPWDLECSNHVEIACAINDGDTTQATADSVMRIRFEQDDFAYVCSAVLLTSNGDQATPPPYVLTAHHCIPDSTVASTVIAYWFYQQATCTESGTDSRFTSISGGANLLLSRSLQDMTLMQLNNSPPSGVSYSDYDTSINFNRDDELIGIHHPDATPKKYWEGDVGLASIDVNVCIDGDVDCFLVSDMFEIWTTSGSLEGGSSGSPAYWSGTNDIAGDFLGEQSGLRQSTSVLFKIQEFLSLY